MKTRDWRGFADVFGRGAEMPRVRRGPTAPHARVIAKKELYPASGLEAGDGIGEWDWARRMTGTAVTFLRGGYCLGRLQAWTVRLTEEQGEHMTYQRVMLKVCEGCGTLWIRKQAGSGVYCGPCTAVFEQFPDPKTRRRPGRPKKGAEQQHPDLHSMPALSMAGGVQ